MRVLHGFAAANIVASYTETPGGGYVHDINAPRNAPAKSPADHLDKIALHSQFYLYESRIDQVVTVNHASIPSDRIYQGFTLTNGSRPIGMEWQGRVSETHHVLLDHGLPYVPLAMVAYDGAMVLSGTIVQTDTTGTRFVSLWADETSVGLGECAYANDVALAAVTRSYRVVVFRTPAPDPEKALFSGTSAAFQIGRGMVDSEATYLRTSETSSDLDMDLERTMDVAGGGVRVVTGGNVQTDRFYTGSFVGGGFIPVDL